MPWYQWQQDDLVISLKVQPKSSKNAFAEIIGNEIKVRITAPPVDGKANTHLLVWLAKQFSVPRSSVVLLSGKRSRHKRVKIRQPGKLPALISAPSSSV